MRIITIGDIHGRDTWIKIVNKEKFDKLIIVADYFDTHEDVSAAIQMHNFKKLIEYKKANPDKVDLLFGNHDLHYLRTIHNQYSGYQMWHEIDISELLHAALDKNLLKMCTIIDNIIFTHAGVTKTWCFNSLLKVDTSNSELLESSINDLFTYKPRMFDFTVGKNYDIYGDDICQTPVWVRPESLIADKLDNYKQVVGHTTQEKIVIYDGIAFIDTLASEEYLVIENGIMIPTKL
jgi:hypothetical protein